MSRVVLSGPGRVLRVLVGAPLVIGGAYFSPFIALAVIAVGTVLVVEAAAGESLLPWPVSRRDETATLPPHAQRAH